MRIVGGLLLCVLVGLCAAEWPMCDPLPSGGSGARWITPTFRYESYIHATRVCSGACILGSRTCRFECDLPVSDISGSCLTEDRCEYIVTIVGFFGLIPYYFNRETRVLFSFAWMALMLLYPIFLKLFSPKKKAE